MIKTMLYDSASQAITTGGTEQLEVWRENPNLVVWLDIDGETETVARPLLESFDLHPLGIEDGLKRRRPPKFEAFGEALLILWRGLDADTHGMDFGVIQLATYVGDRFLITYHLKRSVSVVHSWELVLDQPEMFAEGPLYIALKTGNYLARRYLDILLDLEPRLDDIEAEIFDKSDDNLLSELTKYKSKLRDISRIGKYHLQLVESLQQSNHALVREELGHEITDLYEQVERAVSLSSLYYETACDLTDGYLALTSHKLNRVMQILTVITVVFVPLTFIAGIYGMNFENMPELHSTYGYFIVLGTMASIGVLLIATFRKNGWL